VPNSLQEIDDLTSTFAKVNPPLAPSDTFCSLFYLSRASYILHCYVLVRFP
jgi:hypothetical protein